MKHNSRLFWITRSAALTALLVVFQGASSALGSTLVTGSGVNFLLAVSVMTCGVPTGAAVAVLSPVLAKLLGVGPLWSLIPFIVLGNLALVAVWHALGNLRPERPGLGYLAAAALAALAKFLVLYLGIVRVAVPLLLRLPEPQAGVVSGMFSYPQLFTALAGGGAAALVLPPLRRALGAGPG